MFPLGITALFFDSLLLPCRFPFRVDRLDARCFQRTGPGAEHHLDRRRRFGREIAALRVTGLPRIPQCLRLLLQQIDALLLRQLHKKNRLYSVL